MLMALLLLLGMGKGLLQVVQQIDLVKVLGLLVPAPPVLLQIRNLTMGPSAAPAEWTVGSASTPVWISMLPSSRCLS